jgi:hypothetical protein
MSAAEDDSCEGTASIEGIGMEGGGGKSSCEPARGPG